MADEPSPTLPNWIAEILDRWVPPKDYDARLSAIVDGYITDQAKVISPRASDPLR